MRILVKGNAVEKLRKLKTKLDARKTLLETISKNCAEEALELVRETFSQEEDPYGSPWAPLKTRAGAILQDTGRLRNSWHISKTSRNGFVVASGVEYAAFHQYGTKRGLPARPMIPWQGLPDEWRDRLSEVANEVLKRHFLG